MRRLYYTRAWWSSFAAPLSVVHLPFLEVEQLLVDDAELVESVDVELVLHFCQRRRQQQQRWWGAVRACARARVPVRVCGRVRVGLTSVLEYSPWS